MATSAREQSALLAALLRREHLALSEFLVALAAFDAARGWVELGYRSLFELLLRELGLPKGPAYYRMIAAGLIQRYPEVVEPLRDGRLNLTSVTQLAKVINAGEPRRSPAPLLQPVEARGEGGRRGDRSRRGAAGPHRRHGGASPGAPGLDAPACTSGRGSSGRTDFDRAWPLVRADSRAPAADAGRAAHRGAEPAPRHRFPAAPRQARGGAGCAVAFPPGRFGGDHPRGRSRPHPGAPREAARDRREAVSTEG